jgi:hypothetical protein
MAIRRGPPLITSSDLHAPDPTESSLSEDDIELLESAMGMIRASAGVPR